MYDNVLEYVDYMEKELAQYNVSEDSKMKLLAMNIWSHRQQVKEELSNAKSVSNFKYLIKQKDKKKVRNVPTKPAM